MFFVWTWCNVYFRFTDCNVMKHFLGIPVLSCSILLWEPRLQHYNRMEFAYKRRFRWSGITLRNLLCTDFSITPISFLMHALNQYAQVGVCWTVSFGDTTSSDWVKLEALNSIMCPCLLCAEPAATCQTLKVIMSKVRFNHWLFLIFLIL